jgi:hypothetical protein
MSALSRSGFSNPSGWLINNSPAVARFDYCSLKCYTKFQLRVRWSPAYGSNPPWIHYSLETERMLKDRYLKKKLRMSANIQLAYPLLQLRLSTVDRNRGSS